MKKYRIAAIQGDGIGKEIVPEGIRVIDAAARKAGIQFEWQQFPWSCAYYKETGSDLGPACTGTIGIAPSANLNPERVFPSMFEPVHGSAPDIAGKGVANPIGQIWARVMMLEHLGEHDAAGAIIKAIETVLANGPKTRDIGGSPRRIPPGTGSHDCQEPLVDIPFDTSGSVKVLLHGEHTSSNSLCN